MIQAVILAGGKGTRLAAVSDDLPKPLVPVGGEPIPEFREKLLLSVVRECRFGPGLDIENADDDHTSGRGIEPEARDHVLAAPFEIFGIGDVALEILEQILERSVGDLLYRLTDSLDVQNKCAHTDISPAARAASSAGCNACRPVASAI